MTAGSDGPGAAANPPPVGRRLHNDDWGYESNCFVCERRNERGLRVPFFHDTERDAVTADLVDLAVAEADVLPRAVELAAPLAPLDTATMAANKKMLYGHLEEAVATL